MAIGPAGVLDSTALPERPVRYALGLLGFIFGVTGLIAAVAGPHIAQALKPLEPPPQKLADKLAEAGDKFVGRLLDRVRGKQAEKVVDALPPAPPAPWGWYLSVAATALGLVGAVAGTGAWIRRENHRLAASAIITGSLAVAWVYIVAALVLALAIMFLVMMFGTLGG
jgi:hypothetical protein